MKRTILAAATILTATACTTPAPPTPTTAPAPPAPVVVTQGPIDPAHADDEYAIFAADDTLAHEACVAWASEVPAGAQLADVVDTIQWNLDHADNAYLSMRRDLTDRDPSSLNIICEWNGYHAVPGSPSDLIG